MSIQDRLAIQDLQVQYAIALDRRDWESLRGVFLPDVSVDYPGDVHLDGFENVRDYCDRALSRFRTTQHLLGNPVVVVVGDSATASVTLQASHVTGNGDEGDVYTLWGTYYDRLVRTPAGWRIAERRLTSWATQRLAGGVG
jgi:3-phenylpropionate/cinnamic acid dioxygenase small subunit